MKLPKIGPTKTRSFFEEYLYALLALVFFAITILGKAGGFSTYNAVVVGAWVTAILWCAHQLKDYFAEKSKAENEKAPVPQERAETPKGPVELPSDMKPMIGLKWPVKQGTRASWPELQRKRQVPTAQPHVIQPSTMQESSPEAPPANPNEKKRAFVYERPTLPGRAPKLPHNWANLKEKKQNDKKPDNKKPKR